jgi:hypothetical protein
MLTIVIVGFVLIALCAAAIVIPIVLFIKGW